MKIGQPGAHSAQYSPMASVCAADAAQLFDLKNDPHERVNLVSDPAHVEIAQAFETEARSRWDNDAIRAQVLASQACRRVIQPALETGRMTPWDYTPPRDATQEYVRNTVSGEDVLHRMQYPGPESHD